MPMDEKGQNDNGERPDLTVIIVTHNRADLAVATIRSARSVIGGLTTQWLIVDSGSTDGTPELIEQTFADISVERRPNIGFAAANNAAIGHARGRYVLFLNPDVEVAQGNFASLIARLDQRPSIGIASVTQLDDDGRLLFTIRRDPSVLRTLAEALGLPRIPGLRTSGERDLHALRYRGELAVDWLVGALLLVRAEALQAVGPFDERFFLYSEETDWCYRFRQAGWTVAHEPLMAVTHHTSGNYSPDLLAQLSYAKMLFARKHYGRARAAGIHAGLVLRHLLRNLAAAMPNADGVPDTRIEAERRALVVLLGLRPPPFAAQAQPGHGAGGSVVI
jgi:N-acetylglucosaminyl-diphospho-decaprenol L-rhamnosyltransferase